MNVSEVTLNKIRVAANMLIDEELLMDSSIEIERMAEGKLRLQLSGYLLGESVQREEIRYPADWIQALKERWLPDSAKRRWPVRYRTTILDAKLLYTQFKPSLTNEPYRIDVSKLTLD